MIFAIVISISTCSQGDDFKGPWNEGKSPVFGEEWKYIDDPIDYVRKTNGLLKEKAEGSSRTEMSVQKNYKLLSAERKSEVDKATTPDNGEINWQH